MLSLAGGWKEAVSISGSDSLAAESGGYQGRRRPSEGLHAARFRTVSASNLEEEGKRNDAHSKPGWCFPSNARAQVKEKLQYGRGSQNVTDCCSAICIFQLPHSLLSPPPT